MFGLCFPSLPLTLPLSPSFSPSCFCTSLPTSARVRLYFFKLPLLLLFFAPQKQNNFFPFFLFTLLFFCVHCTRLGFGDGVHVQFGLWRWLCIRLWVWVRVLVWVLVNRRSGGQGRGTASLHLVISLSAACPSTSYPFARVFASLRSLSLCLRLLRFFFLCPLLIKIHDGLICGRCLGSAGWTSQLLDAGLQRQIYSSS